MKPLTITLHALESTDSAPSPAAMCDMLCAVLRGFKVHVTQIDMAYTQPRYAKTFRKPREGGKSTPPSSHS